MFASIQPFPVPESDVPKESLVVAEMNPARLDRPGDHAIARTGERMKEGRLIEPPGNERWSLTKAGITQRNRKCKSLLGPLCHERNRREDPSAKKPGRMDSRMVRPTDSLSPSPMKDTKSRRRSQCRSRAAGLLYGPPCRKKNRDGPKTIPAKVSSYKC